jgi:hypothetical protein
MKANTNNKGGNMTVECIICEEEIEKSEAKYSFIYQTWACNDCLEESE